MRISDALVVRAIRGRDVNAARNIRAAARRTLSGVGRAAERQRVLGSQSSPSFPQAPGPGERVPCLGSAKPIACDATAGSDLDTVAGSRTMNRREDGTAQPGCIR